MKGKQLSQAVEDYLKTIYQLRERGAISTTEIARGLNVAPASVTNMIKRLARMKLVEHRAYKGVRLTEKGETAALDIIRRHRLLETYLKVVMGFSWDRMHEEADRLEHHISRQFENKLDEILDYPTHDPHGHPIPTREGTVAEPKTAPLAEAEPGQVVTVHDISDTDPEVLTYLEDIGLLPRIAVEVVEKAPFDGPLTVRIDEQNRVIGHRVACGIFVTCRTTVLHPAELKARPDRSRSQPLT